MPTSTATRQVHHAGAELPALRGAGPGWRGGQSGPILPRHDDDVLGEGEFELTTTNRAAIEERPRLFRTCQSCKAAGRPSKMHVVGFCDLHPPKCYACCLSYQYPRTNRGYAEHKEVWDKQRATVKL